LGTSKSSLKIQNVLKSILKQFQEKHKQPRNSTRTILDRKFGQVLTDSKVHQHFIKGQEERQNQAELQIKRKAKIYN
jgi:hypothetical protein